MRAMLLESVGPLSDGRAPLIAADWPEPDPGAGEVQIRVSTCAVCHTELDEIEGRMPPPKLPIIPGHQVVGRVEALGAGVTEFQPGDRVGVAWIHHACGHCDACRKGLENLCPAFWATGRDTHGGYAEKLVVPADFALVIPEELSDTEAAPLLCAGAIGYRSLKLTGLEDGQDLGLTGFGASGHLVLKLIEHLRPRSRVFVFARSEEERAFARDLGAAWAGDTGEPAPQLLHAIIDTTPAWTPIVRALQNLRPGGRLVINAIRKEAADKSVLLEVDYPRQLWLEKEIKSVANVTRADVRRTLEVAADAALIPTVEVYPLADANQALLDLKSKHVRGAKVLRIS
jgi:propanol-preferring alcohol dehydrogenase